MNDGFDAHYKWLGIPPEDQPPNHYRLLGVPLFESDSDVIDNAAEQRILLVRTFQIGKHSDESQRILNEIFGARVCLLNPEQKAVYDIGLRRKLQEPSEPDASLEFAGWASENDSHIGAQSASCLCQAADEQFDPYYKWLGIPPDQQPANFYRLLGLDLFESDRDAIANAAISRMAYVSKFLIGKDSDAAQRILDEISSAKARLTNPERKTVYDAELHLQLAGPSPPEPPPVAPADAPSFRLRTAVRRLVCRVGTSLAALAGGANTGRQLLLRWLSVALAVAILILCTFLTVLWHRSKEVVREDHGKSETAVPGSSAGSEAAADADTEKMPVLDDAREARLDASNGESVSSGQKTASEQDQPTKVAAKQESRPKGHSVSSGKDGVSERDRPTERTGTQEPQAVAVTAPGITEKVQQGTESVGTIKLKIIDQSFEISGCYASFSRVGTAGIGVLQLQSYQHADTELFPSVFVRVQCSANRLAELAGQTVPAQLFVQLDVDGPLWTATAEPVQLKITAIEKTLLRAEIIGGNVAHSGTGNTESVTGSFEAALP